MKKHIAIIIELITIVISGFELSFGWNTFVLRIFDLPKVNVFTAIALAQMYEIITYKYKDTSNIDDNEWLKITCINIFNVLLVFLILFVLSLF